MNDDLKQYFGLDKNHGEMATPNSTIPGTLPLRDQFAIAAMQGDWICSDKTSDNSDPYAYYRLSREAYKLADAMMKVRGELPETHSKLAQNYRDHVKLQNSYRAKKESDAPELTFWQNRAREASGMKDENINQLPGYTSWIKKLTNLHCWKYIAHLDEEGRIERPNAAERTMEGHRILLLNRPAYEKWFENFDPPHFLDYCALHNIYG